MCVCVCVYIYIYISIAKRGADEFMDGIMLIVKPAVAATVQHTMI